MISIMSDLPAREALRIGLCATCAHARRMESDRGSVFLRCELAFTDSRFRKYPTLPVLRCEGYRASVAQP